ncbi:MAG: hypothetical protein LBD29_10600 [Treponema sp.]|jgi:hypothetical protein|nr:hypothetical protein [Treponema sp.]
MKRLLSVIFLSAVAGELIAVPEPLWYQHKESVYPDADFVSALGIGPTLKEAEAEALKNIALYFKTTLSAQNELISQYSELSSPGGAHEGKKITVMKNAVIVKTQADLQGLRFTPPWYNEQSGSWAVLGYINKQEARHLYQNRIAANQQVMDSLTAAARGETERLYQYNYLKIAASVAGLVEADCRAMAEIAETPEGLAEILGHTRSVIADCLKFRLSVVFDIQIEADRRGRIRQKLAQILENQGYGTDSNRGIYRITGTVRTYEEPLPSGNYVSSGIILQMVNNEGLLLFSYSADYARQGSKNWETAYNAAFREIEKDLETNFITQFNAFLGG